MSTNKDFQNKLVCVVNDYAIFDEVIKNNENLADFEITDFDNREENVAITKRYNSFIEENVANNADDFWVLFVHQDFGFMENPNPMLKAMDKASIWGAVGVNLYKGLFLGKDCFKPSITIAWGRILQGNNDFNFKEYGRKIWFKKTVDAVDCCCVMVHSSLIKKYNLRFDENLSFHMYAEELCYRAKKDHKIKSKVVPMKCFHLGKGNLNEEFSNSVKYLKEKFKINRVPSTCRN